MLTKMIISFLALLFGFCFAQNDGDLGLRDDIYWQDGDSVAFDTTKTMILRPTLFILNRSFWSWSADSSAFMESIIKERELNILCFVYVNRVDSLKVSKKHPRLLQRIEKITYWNKDYTMLYPNKDIDIFTYIFPMFTKTDTIIYKP